MTGIHPITEEQCECSLMLNVWWLRTTLFPVTTTSSVYRFLFSITLSICVRRFLALIRSLTGLSRANSCGNASDSFSFFCNSSILFHVNAKAH